MDIENLLKKRSLPGVLVLSEEGTLLFLNSAAGRILGVEGGSVSIPDELSALLTAKDDPAPIVFEANGTAYFARAGKLTSPSGKNVLRMIQIERCSGRNAASVNSLRQRFGLTEREAQVVREVLKGSSNQEVAHSLSITEHTVKDYLKKVMMKLKVNSRSMVISRVIGYS